MIVLTLLVSLLLILFIIPLILLKLSNRENLNIFNQFINTPINKPFFSNNFDNESKINKNLIFVPHPFTNWSLNPLFKNQNGYKEHTTEGFKKTTNVDSIQELISKNNFDFIIICIGGSSTHCQEMESYDLTWPAKLNNKLNKNKFNKKILVINFGVGAWNTIQSTIRCITWFPIIKPDLVIFYHSKNDLTPVCNGNKLEKKIMPDYQNVMNQYSIIFINNFFKNFLKIPLIKYLLYKSKFNRDFSQYGINSIYYNLESVGLKRLDKDIINSIEDRHIQIINLCELYNTKVLYIPEVVLDDLYSPKLEIIMKSLKNKIYKKKSVEWFDVKNILENQSNIFLDKMHFSENGNEFFSTLLSEKIKNTYFE